MAHKETTYPQQMSTSEIGRAAGFTLVEVMMALGILTIGAMGVMSLHRATTRGNGVAHELSTANEIATLWLERVQRDALLWQAQGVAGIASTQYLSQAPLAGGMSDWFAPRPAVDSNESFAFDYRGADTDIEEQMVFCTHLRVGFVIPGQSIRAEVRVWWHRLGEGSGDGISDRTLFTDCAPDNPANVSDEINRIPSRLHVTRAATVVRWGAN